MTDVITSGVLDDLAKEKSAFHELSMSRLGYARLNSTSSPMTCISVPASCGASPHPSP